MLTPKTNSWKSTSKIQEKDCGVDILNAVKMITENPSKLLKVNKGVLESGKDADVIVFDEDIIVNSVFIDGKKVK